MNQYGKQPDSIVFFSICVVATVADISMGDKKFKSAIKLVWGSLSAPQILSRPAKLTRLAHSQLFPDVAPLIRRNQ